MKYFVSIVLSFIFILPVKANMSIDFDGDGISDFDEINIYHTDPKNPDTDGDGWNDWVELNNGYSPHHFLLSLEDSDLDGDGLSDRLELSFHTNIDDFDTDGDGYSDGIEIANAYDPLSKEIKKLDKEIRIDLEKQKLGYFLSGIRLGEYVISSGVNNSTPSKFWRITNKHPKAWLPYGLWMPYWLGLDSGRYGIHELPIWPNGYREGEDHLGSPASHGCIRLGENDAKELYDWAEIGTLVYTY